MEYESFSLEDKQELISKADNGKKNAYSPYSEYSVGAALAVEADDPNVEYTVYTGGNIENGNFTNTIHAEQVAISSAISNGVGPENFLALAVSTEDKEGGAPCGLCQQSLAEFVPDSFPLLLDEGDGFREISLGEGELFRPEF